jgi:hypothetical protein
LVFLYIIKNRRRERRRRYCFAGRKGRKDDKKKEKGKKKSKKKKRGLNLPFIYEHRKSKNYNIIEFETVQKVWLF